MSAPWLTTATEGGTTGPAPAESRVRPAQLAPVHVTGKFLATDTGTLHVRGVTYGTFDGSNDLPEPAVAATDFAQMSAAGVNAVRVYTVPPRWMLDLAAAQGLRVLVGIPWEQHLTFLDSRSRCRKIERDVRSAIRACNGHEAVLGYVIGNEIPTAIVRWHGRARVERFLERLYTAAKSEAPTAIVTYANYPSTEYLDLPFLDVVAFNVFLEDPAELTSYLARLQAIAGDRPLVITECGLDSQRHGQAGQAASVAAQVDAVFAAGCAGGFVFSWTDDWSRNGERVDDWQFGVVDRTRAPKPALAALQAAFANAPFGQLTDWPRVSVVVCSYNGGRTIAETVDALGELDYRSYETIVVDDGSADDTAAIAASRGLTVIRTVNQGLSAARNEGIRAADGEIIAFCDDDCSPDRHWLQYLVTTMRAGDFAGVGGPNIPPPSTLTGDSVGHAPGGPTHVLLSPSVAEHIPGCNMAFRRSVLDDVRGFDPRFRVAGDDVDVCWRIQEAGGTLGFSPGAVVWHQPRTAVRGYARQQLAYGRAEAHLERKWPERYNSAGHIAWGVSTHGGKTRKRFSRRRWQVYYGRGGSALFQSVYSSHTRHPAAFPLAPEWYLFLLALCIATIWQTFSGPLMTIPPVGLPVSVLLLLLAVVVMVSRAILWAAAVILPPSMPARRRVGTRILVGYLCLLQPLARLSGRASEGLTPWRGRGTYAFGLPRSRVVSAWADRGMPAEAWMTRLKGGLATARVQVADGGDFDTWDVQTRVGPLAAGRLRLGIEDHGNGRQMVRLRAWPRISKGAALAEILLVALTILATTRGEMPGAVLLGGAAMWFAIRVLMQASTAVIAPIRVIAELDERSALSTIPAHPVTAASREAA